MIEDEGQGEQAASYYDENGNRIDMEGEQEYGDEQVQDYGEEG